MAEYTERLLEPWRRRVEEQAEEIGYLKTELRQARVQAEEAIHTAEERAAAQGHTAEEIGRLKAELEHAQRRAAAVEAAAEARRPWWRFW